MDNYAAMKESLRLKFAKKQADFPAPDLEKIKDEIREEFRKKNRGDKRSFELKYEGIELRISSELLEKLPPFGGKIMSRNSRPPYKLKLKLKKIMTF